MKGRIVRVFATVGSLLALGAAAPVLAGSPMGSSRAETCVKGVVTEVNQADRTILMVDALGREALIRYDGETLFMVRGEPSGRGELRKGAQITVTNHTANRVSLLPCISVREVSSDSMTPRSRSMMRQ